MDFVALDFETANRNWNSACEIGLVVVEGGRVVDTYRRLIRPTPNRFDRGNIRVHGIRPEDVADAPTFAEIYDELLPYLTERHLVAHNASFDIGVLTATARLYGLPKPSLTYSCTVRLARKVWPEAPRYGLGVISGFLGIELNHHQALSDANACAQIMLRANDLLQAPSTEELLGELGMRPRPIEEFGSQSRRRKSSWSRPRAVDTRPRAAEPQRDKPRTRVENWPTHPRIKDIRFDASNAHPGHPAYGKRFVFTGELEACSREDAMRRVLENGGRCTGSVTGATDFLVQGVPTWRKVTSKVRKARELEESGKRIRLIDEAAFWELMGEGGSDDV